jgi:aromatic-L-amino-acid/L-tryptophan decarboxylase
MGIVCFRFVGAPRSATAATTIDELNSQIVERINASGRAYLTQTRLRARTVMRIGLGNVLTTEQHLRNAWKLIQKMATEVAA